MEKRKDHKEGKDSGRKLPGKHTFPLLIKYPATTLLIALMRK